MGRRRSRRLGETGRPPLRWAPVLGLSLVILVSGWTLLWWFARAEAKANFHTWLAGERALGRTWDCPDESLGGFPLAITLRCEHPTFKGPVADGVYQGSLAGIEATADLYFPTRVTVTLAPPLAATEVATGRRVQANWSSAVLTLRGLLPDGLERGLFEAADLVLADGGQPQDTVRVGQLSLGFKPLAKAAGASRGDLDVVLDASAMRIPALDAVAGSSEPLTVHVAGLATQVRFDGGATAAEVLGPWSDAGGQLTVRALDIDKGPFRLRASGRVGLDPDHRPEGRLDAGFTGLQPVADRLGLPLGLIQAGGALASLLGGSKPAADGTELTLPIVARNGALLVGPVRTRLALQPLY